MFQARLSNIYFKLTYVYLLDVISPMSLWVLYMRVVKLIWNSFWSVFVIFLSSLVSFLLQKVSIHCFLLVWHICHLNYIILAESGEHFFEFSKLYRSRLLKWYSFWRLFLLEKRLFIAQILWILKKDLDVILLMIRLDS